MSQPEREPTNHSWLRQLKEHCMPVLTSKAKPKSPYSVHPSATMMQKWSADLPRKTGRSREQWIALTQKSGPASERECCDWLKREHRLGTNIASWIAERATGKDEGDFGGDPEVYLSAADAYVKAMFSGKKTPLHPLYDELLRLGLNLGKDVKACPCKTIVPLYRN